MTYSLILVDGNSIGYAAHHATKLHANGKQTQAVFGVLKTINELQRSNPHATIRVLWDGRREQRFALLPTYKDGRDDTPDKVLVREAYSEQKPWITAALSSLGIQQDHYANLEADDVAGYFVAKLKGHPTARVLLLTGDEDWLQLIAPNIDWHDRRKGLTVTLANLCEVTGYLTPYAFLEGKCLTGDTSDKIKGVGGIGEKGAPEFIAESSLSGRRWTAESFAPRRRLTLGWRRRRVATCSSGIWR
jgi:5'-3' exonuclease